MTTEWYLPTRCVHCCDGEHEDCRSPDCGCTHPSHAGEGDGGIEQDEWDDSYGWGDDDE